MFQGKHASEHILDYGIRKEPLEARTLPQLEVHLECQVDCDGGVASCVGAEARACWLLALHMRRIFEETCQRIWDWISI